MDIFYNAFVFSWNTGVKPNFSAYSLAASAFRITSEGEWASELQMTSAFFSAASCQNSSYGY